MRETERLRAGHAGRVDESSVGVRLDQPDERAHAIAGIEPIPNTKEPGLGDTSTMGLPMGHSLPHRVQCREVHAGGAVRPGQELAAGSDFI